MASVRRETDDIKNIIETNAVKILREKMTNNTCTWKKRKGEINVQSAKVIKTEKFGIHKSGQEQQHHCDG